MEPLKILVYGDNGVGKTTFASNSKNPIILSLDGNSSHIDCDKVFIENLEQLNDALDFLQKKEHEYSTLVIDDTETLEKFIIDDILKRTGKRGLDSFSHGSGYKYITEGFHRLLLGKIDWLWKNKKMSVVLIAHSKQISKLTPGDENYLAWDISVYNKASALLKTWCRCVFFLKTNHEVDDNKRIKRVLFTEPSHLYPAKNVYDLPSEIELTKDSWKIVTDKILEFFNKSEKNQNKKIQDKVATDKIVPSNTLIEEAL